MTNLNDASTSTTRPEGFGYEIADFTTRRQFIELLALPPMTDSAWTELPNLANDPSDMVALSIRALAAEVLALGLMLIETQEKVATLEGLNKFFGSMVGGLMGTPVPDDDEEGQRSQAAQDLAFTCLAARMTGAAIRAGAGLGAQQ